jgi:hypothetical protein
VFCPNFRPQQRAALLSFAANSRELPQAAVKCRPLLRFAIFCRKVFGNAFPYSFSIEGGVKPLESNHQQQDWITEARRRLAEKKREKPETKAGQIWALWPEIKAAMAADQHIATICLCLQQEAGIQITPKVLTSYIGRCRKKEKSGHVTPNAAVSSTQPNFRSTDDPMAVAREALNKPRFDIRKIHGDGDPSDHNLI